MTRVIALMALAALGLTEAPVHEPVHGRRTAISWPRDSSTAMADLTMEGTELKWRKSSYSGNGGGECVEIGASPGAVVVRDTTDRTGPVLRFTPAGWRRFADQVKRSLASGLEACRVALGLGVALRRPTVSRQATVTLRNRHEEIAAHCSWHESWHD
jgi:hypothetical protein